MLKQFKTAVILFGILTIITGVIYPVVITIIAQVFFNWQANGSIIKHNGKAIGSVLIGQTFTDPKYFWGRPSATTPTAYNAGNSSGSNLGPTNPALYSAIMDRVKNLQATVSNSKLIPIDLVTASASGLDPEISPMAAMYQVPRIAKARGVQENEIELLIQKITKQRTFKILGEPRVNVLELNMGLDAFK